MSNLSTLTLQSLEKIAIDAYRRNDFDAGRAGMTVSFRARFDGESGGVQALSLRLASEDDAAAVLRALRSLRLACAPLR